MKTLWNEVSAIQKVNFSIRILSHQGWVAMQRKRKVMRPLQKQRRGQWKLDNLLNMKRLRRDVRLGLRHRHQWLRQEVQYF